MESLLTKLGHLRRPQILIRAARVGVMDYRRSTHLRRHLGAGTLPRNGPALMRLVEMEQALNDRRLSRDASYSASAHVDLLIAMMGEARLLRASRA